MGKISQSQSHSGRFTGSRYIETGHTPTCQSSFKENTTEKTSQYQSHSGLFTGSRYIETGDTPTDQGRLKFKRSPDNTLYLSHFRDQKTPLNRKPLSKNRIYLQTPRDWYSYDLEYKPDVTSSSRQKDTDSSWSFNDRWNSYGEGRKIVYDKMFQAGNNRSPRKGMIVEEQPPSLPNPRRRRPELPGNLSLDNLRDQNLDWRKYNKVSWSDIMNSHMEDVNQQRVYIQTMPQKEHWLASIENHSYRHPGQAPYSNRGFPYRLSPRLFNNKVTQNKGPVPTKYVSKDRQGNLFYIVGPGDVTSKEYRPFVLPEIDTAPPQTPKKLNF